MHPLTPLILETWRRLLPKLLKNPDELNKRLSRRRATTFSRPSRPWCLALRATDSRLNAFARNLPSSLITPRSSLSPLNPEPRTLNPQSITITSDLLLHLNRPIHLDTTGQDAADLAKLLGSPPSALRLARHRNLLRAHHVPLLSNKRGRPIPILHSPTPLHPAHPLRQPPDPLWGHIFPNTHPRPLLPESFSQQIERIPTFRPRSAILNPEPRTLNPRNRSFHLPPPPPDYVWYKWKNNHYLGHPHDPPSLNRHAHPHLNPEPRTLNPRPNRRPKRASGSLLFHGYAFLCPSCQKPKRTLYLPLFAVHSLNLLATLAAIRNPQSEIRNPQSKSLNLNPEPRTLNPLLRNDPAHPDAYAPPPQSLACHTCHRIRNTSLLERDGWNILISHLSAGLLYGHEVPKPDWLTPTRKRPHRPALHRPAPRRSQVLRRLLNGWPIPKIAKDLQISRRAVHHHVKLLCQQEQVPDRHALAAKFNSPHARPPLPSSTGNWPLPTGDSLLPSDSSLITHSSSLSYVKHRRATIRSLLLAGLTRRQIMRRLNLPPHTVHYDTNRIYKAHEVHSAAALIEKLNTDVLGRSRQSQ